jgi:hypothetical protein
MIYVITVSTYTCICSIYGPGIIIGITYTDLMLNV